MKMQSLLLLYLSIIPVFSTERTKKTVIFAVGIEGSYHHYVGHIFKEVGAGILCMYNPSVVQWKEHWEDAYMEWLSGGNITTAYNCKQLNHDVDVIVHASDSFPEGRPLTPNSFPNHRGFLSLNESGKIELRLLFLNRDIIEATLSALLRFKPTGQVHTLGTILINSMDFIATLCPIPHFVFSDSDNVSTQVLNMQSLLRGIAAPEAVTKAFSRWPFRFHRHTSATDLLWRKELEGLVGPRMNSWPPELTRGTIFMNQTKILPPKQ